MEETRILFKELSPRYKPSHTKAIIHKKEREEPFESFQITFAS